MSVDETIVNYRKPKPTPGGRGDATQVRMPKPAPGARGGVPNLELSPSQSQPLSGASSADGTLPGGTLPDVALPATGKVYGNTINPLLAAAQPLVDEIAALNQPGDEKPLESYRQKLVTAMGQFEMSCGQSGVDEDSILYSRYVLCTALDEMVNKTPWPNKGEWNRHSLLAQFHGETGGGEKFFDLLDHLLIHPASHLAVLELMFVCLNLGFEGKYHLVPRGHLQLEQVKDNLYQVIRLQRGDAEPGLSPHWQAASGKRQKLVGYIPAWVIVAVSGLLLMLMFSGFHYLIEEQGDAAVNRIGELASAPGDSRPESGQKSLQSQAKPAKDSVQ